MYMLSHNNFIDLSIICKESDELELTAHVLLNFINENCRQWWRTLTGNLIVYNHLESCHLVWRY